METVSSAPPQDTSEANPSSAKSDDDSPQRNNRTGSPPPNCAICLGACKNKSFTDSCLHQFCFNCLLRWSKVKAECPLCKQNFKSIIHNVRSNHQYEEYMVEQRSTEVLDRIDIEDLTTANRRFRYRTTLTLPRRDTLAIRDLLIHFQPLSNTYAQPPPRQPPVCRRRRSPSLFRPTVYRRNLWARPLPDFTGRFRDCTPEFYRYNDTQMYRLVPWLNRELHYLLNENVGHISYVIERMLEILPQYHISSAEFREAMVRYLGDRTDHFLHELYCFASTPYDLSGYDRNVQYTTDTRVSTMIVNEVISSSDSEATVDSDIVVISSSEPTDPPPGPSRLPAPTYPQNFIPPPVNNPITIESISQSDTDDDSSEVMVVGYIKPPQERTPEVVDLLGSDSDVVVQESEPQVASTEEPRVPMVKLSLRRTETKPESDSEDSAYTPPPPKRRRTSRSNDYATTSDTSRSTPSRSAMDWESDSSFLSYRSTCTSPMSSTTSVSCSYSDSDHSERKKNKKKSRRKRKERETSSNDKKRRKKRSHKNKSMSTERDKKRKYKSRSGKGVKSSKKNQQSEEVQEEANSLALDQPSTSGTSSSIHKSGRDRKRRRSSRENKRLKSVVNVMNSNKSSGDSCSSGNSNLLDILSSTILNQNSNSGSMNGDLPLDLSKKVDSCLKVEVPEKKEVTENSSDSEENQYF